MLVLQGSDRHPETMPTYTAISYSPVQGFIERSRKLRDLYGASGILSYLSYKVVEFAKSHNMEVISPGQVNVKTGMTNRILIKGNIPEEEGKQIIKKAWKAILKECRIWIEEKLPNEEYFWYQEWKNWGIHAWDIAWGQGESIPEAMKDLETRKLSRDWTGLNWIGYSSSISGTDAIAWSKLGSKDRHPQNYRDGDWRGESEEIKKFYSRLASVLEGKKPEEKAVGNFIDSTERLSIPELVKRMVTHPDISKKFPGLPQLEEKFKDIVRKPDPDAGHTGQWTGWFMGDGDKVGDKLSKLAKEGDEEVNNFSKAMRVWGDKFADNFDLGRIIYAGGDDFLGVVYSKNVNQPQKPHEAYEWLKGLNAKWKEHEQGISLSLGFVWAANSVPQRDVLQHCREAEKVSKNRGRDRVTIRVLFNSGQYVQWTCPWNYLHILDLYQDRDKQSNWAHIYNDLAHLKSRRAIDLNQPEEQADAEVALALFDIYFSGEAEYLSDNQKDIVGDTSEISLIKWIDDLILVGWQLCFNSDI